MPHPTAPKRHLTAHLLLVAVALVWGSTFPLVKAALRDTSPLLFNLLRMAIASVILLVANITTLRNLTKAQWKLSAMAGLLLALGYECQTVGLTSTTPSKSAFLTGLVVVLVPLLSALPAVRSPATPRPGLFAYAGATFAFLGIVLLTANPGTGFALLSGLHRGEWLTLAAALAFALHLLTLARAAAGIPPRALGTLQIAFATLAMLLLLPLERHPFVHWTPMVLVALAVTAVFATAAAFTIQSWAQTHLPASHTALIFTLEPVFAALTSLLVFGERLRPEALAGAGFILSGILLAEVGPTVKMRAGILPMEP